jgi:hypothetical protein
MLEFNYYINWDIDMMLKKQVNAFSWLVAFFCVIKLSVLLKISPMSGSYSGYFGMNNAFIPLSGLWAGLWGATSISGISLGLKMFLYGSFPLRQLAHIIPGYCASLYWVFQGPLMPLGIPLLCMMLFILHPIGFYAFLYTWYWFIPMGLYFLKNKNFFLQALSSTFIAHAVGSVIWIYTVPMSIDQWHALIPIVAIERFTFALGMVTVFHVARIVKNLICCFYSLFLRNLLAKSI